MIDTAATQGTQHATRYNNYNNYNKDGGRTVILDADRSAVEILLKN